MLSQDDPCDDWSDCKIPETEKKPKDTKMNNHIKNLIKGTAMGAVASAALFLPMLQVF